MNSTRSHRPGVRAALQILLGFVLITCLVPDPALAYIDPGTGSFILQGILAAIVGIGLVVKIYWRKILTLFGRNSAAEDDDIDD